MTRTMYDAVTAANIPADATLVAGYIDANYAWSAADWQRFPNATLVKIAVYPWTNDGHVIDIEPGNWEPPDAPEWCRMRRQAGQIPTLYTMRSWWQWCIDEFNAQGEPQPHYWIADWDGDATLPHGAIAKQYANGTMLGAGYDLNIVADHWPGVDDEEEDMQADERAALLDIRAQLTGSRVPGEYPGWESWVGNGESLTATDYARAADMHLVNLRASVAGLTEAVAALSSDSELTAERVEQIIRDAVQQNIDITGTVTVTGKE